MQRALVKILCGCFDDIRTLEKSVRALSARTCPRKLEIVGDNRTLVIPRWALFANSGRGEGRRRTSRSRVEEEGKRGTSRPAPLRCKRGKESRRPRGPGRLGSESSSPLGRSPRGTDSRAAISTVARPLPNLRLSLRRAPGRHGPRQWRPRGRASRQNRVVNRAMVRAVAKSLTTDGKNRLIF